MALSIGIVGLPNVGKSTLFNALTKAQNAEAANYPFCTIEPNKAIVPVPDPRLEQLAKIVQPQRIQHATVDFIDIAGLVRGASKGEGLGNQFLANIRECAAILEVVRCFDDSAVSHVDGTVDPFRDIETIETELLLADLQTVEKRLDRLRKSLKGNKKQVQLISTMESLLNHLGQGKTASTFPTCPSDSSQEIFHELCLLTSKKIIYCANIEENLLGSTENSQTLQKLKKFAENQKAPLVVVCAKLEEELHGIPLPEQEEILNSYKIQESSLAKIIHTGYASLGLIAYFTAGEKEVRSWTIPFGTKAPGAAGEIHSDFERGFIRAEVINFTDFITYGSEAAARSAGALHTEGKEYIVKDGDVIHFLFNV